MFSKETYIGRRKVLMQKLQGRGIVLLPGNSEAPINYHANTYRFRQDSTFLYYFGLPISDLVGIIDTDTGEATLFGDDFTVEDIIWMGPQPRVVELAEQVGVKHTAPLAKLEPAIAEAVARGREIHILRPYRGDTRLMLEKIVPDAFLAPSEMLIQAVVAQRDKKSAEEIAEIEKACAIGHEMHLTAMKMCHPRAQEREIAGAIEVIALMKGWGTSFHSIVSQHGETLHNHSYNGILKEGRMLLVDAGAESVSNYCSDFTRTTPVSGKFTTKQKEIYDIVLAANNHAFSVSAPEIRYVDVHLAAARIIVEGLKELGLVKGDVEKAVSAGTHALFMPHGLGHQMGLDVHDMENLGEQYVGYDAETPRSKHPSCSACRMGRRLEAGMVVTVEPGIYFVPELIAKWRTESTCAEFVNFAAVEKYLDFGGIRLEDDMLITETGNRLLGKRLPITTEEVEAAILPS